MTDPFRVVDTVLPGGEDAPLPVVVIGAGISGLAAATFLRGNVPLVVLEKSDQAGGNVQSDLVEGRVIDRAANGWLNNEPAMGRLLELAGLTDQVVPAGPKAKVRWIFADGQMHAAPLSPPAVFQTRLVSWATKLRLFLEPFMGRGPADGDESVGDFVRRRLGQGFLDRMVGPMVAGIYAADPDKLSLRGAFDRMHQLEKEHGSLILAALRLRRGGAPSGHLETLHGGAGALTQALASQLGGALHTGVTVESVEQRRGRWRVHTDQGALDAKAVVMACPAPVQARLLRGVDPEAAQALEQIPYAPVAVVAAAWGPDAFPTPPDGFGVLHARGSVGAVEGAHGVLGTLFTNCVFPEQGLEGEHLTRTILGGAIAPEVVQLDDQELLRRVTRALSAMLGAPREAPRMVRIYRHEAGIPQYAVGHLGRVAVAKAAQNRHAGLYLVGNHLQGIGVKDCAREGERAAKALLAWVGATTQA